MLLAKIENIINTQSECTNQFVLLPLQMLTVLIKHSDWIWFPSIWKKNKKNYCIFFQDVKKKNVSLSILQNWMCDLWLKITIKPTLAVRWETPTTGHFSWFVLHVGEWRAELFSAAVTELYFSAHGLHEICVKHKCKDVTGVMSLH